MKKKSIAVFLLMIISIGILMGCGKNNTGDNVQSQTEVTDASENSKGYDPNNWLASLNTTDIDENIVTSDIFKKYDLTLVNVWTTWCSTCINEMPYFRDIHEEYKDKGVNIIGIILEQDIGGKKIRVGLSDSEKEVVKEILQESGAQYTNIVASKSLLKTSLKDIDGFPITYFVDKNGKFIGEPYSGGKSRRAWIKTIEEKLKEVK